MTPGGNPASTIRAASFCAYNGQSSGDFMMRVFPAAIAGASFQIVIMLLRVRKVKVKVKAKRW
jgi:hypothetical protein